MTSGSEDLVLKISADTTDVARGLKPMERALDNLEQDVKDLDGTQLELSVKDQALNRARQRIDELRNKIAQDVILGVSTKDAERELSKLQTTVKRLTDTPAKVDVEVDSHKEELADALEGVDSLREGALGLGQALGEANGSMTGFANIAHEMVPALADLNQTMIAMKLRNEAMGQSFGRLGRSVSAVTGFMAGPWGLAVAAGAGLLQGFAAKADAADQATKSLSESIDYQTGAYDRNNRALAAKMLTGQDYFKQGKDLLDIGQAYAISTEDMTSALLGNDEALARVTKGFDDYAAAHKAAAPFVKGFKDDFLELVETNKSTAAEQGRVNRAIGETGQALNETGPELKTQVSYWDMYNTELRDAQKELDDIVAGLDILNGRFADAREATSRYEEGMDNLREALKQTNNTMNLSTDRGRANDALIRTQAKNIDDLARARLRDMETSGESSSKILADYKSQRDQLIVMADKLGLSGAAAKAYVDKLLATPKVVKTQVEQEGAEEAGKEIDDAARDRNTFINVKVIPNLERYNQLPQRIRDAISGNGSINFSAAAPAPAPMPAGGPSTVFLQPRIFLDSRPVRAAMRSDVETVVASTMAATRTRGRM
jgi:chromosome segregation ATPase